MAGLKDIISGSIKEGVDINFDEAFDFEKAEQTFQEHVNGIVTKNVGKETEKVKSETLSNVLKELGIEADDLDSAKLYVKTMNGNTDEFKETNIKLSKQLKELTEKYETASGQLTSLQETALRNQRITEIMKKGIEPEYAEFVEFKLSPQVTEEKPFSELLNEYIDNEDVTPSMRFKKGGKPPKEGIDPSIVKRYPKHFNQ